MDRNSLRTSVVIEVANQEEPNDQKTYQIDFDDLDIPKDYVIDQIFCGENITVYALFEVPEDSSVTSNDAVLNVANSKTHDNYRFFHQNSSKKIMKPTKLNGFRQGVLSSEDSSVNVFPNKDKENGSFYCLRHLSGDYDMLTPERESSDLKVLYSAVSRHSKSKFKAISKGVNTDIVQSPRIINEVQKAVKQNVPFTKTAEVKSVSSSKPSYEVIEMEMRQSFSSLSSYDEYKKQGKGSVPNFFLVPLLMMEDGVLSHFQSDEKIQKSEAEKDVTTQVFPEKVSMGTNTDFLALTTLKNEDKKSESYPDVSTSESVLKLKQLNSSVDGKLKNKANILSEIKKLQGKLNALIKSIETDDFDLDTSELESSAIAQDTPSEKSQILGSGHKQFRMSYDDLPILSTLSYPTQKNEKTKQNERRKEEQNEEVVLEPSKSISVSLLSGGVSSKSQITKTHSILNCRKSKSKEDVKKFSGNSSIIWSQVENHKGAGLSKSATNNHIGFIDAKLNFINGVKKSFSFDLKDVKLEMTSFKKIKNSSFKLDTKPNIRVPQIGEAIMSCEMGDEICNKQKTSKMDLLNLSKKIEEEADLKLAKKDLDQKKDEEGDAKLMYSKQNILSNIINRKTENVVHFCNTINATPKDNMLINEKNVNMKSKGVSNNDTEKIASDVEKPTTPNKNGRKLVSPNNNAKKEVKTLKKVNFQQNKVKSLEKNAKTEVKDMPEPVKQRSVTGSRKFTLKGSAESKLHVDRLMKSENSKLNPEKPGSKSYRLVSQKREQSEPLDENKEKVEKNQKTNSSFTTNKKELKEESEFVMNLERIGEDSGEGSDENTTEKTTKQSGVVVELFSKKPSEILSFNENHKCPGVKKTSGVRKSEESSKLQKEIDDGSLNQGKSIVKSVWALTKVLLFEDGSKKMEILEASLTPPGYSLPKNSSE